MKERPKRWRAACGSMPGRHKRPKISIQLDPDVFAEIERRAAMQNTSFGAIAREVIRNGLHPFATIAPLGQTVWSQIGIASGYDGC